MTIIGDARIPVKARQSLEKEGFFVPFITEGITYEGVAGHPDIFFCRVDEKIVAAPNLPQHYLNRTANKTNIIKGLTRVGRRYPHSAHYNAVVTENFLIHNTKITDPAIKNLCRNKQTIHVRQGYTRCNLLPLPGESFVTSDRGIYESLIKNHLDVLYLAPEGIVLPGFNNGFIGGCTGVYGHKVFFIGSLKFYPEGEKLRNFILSRGFGIVELYEGPLFDGGSLIFI